MNCLARYHPAYTFFKELLSAVPFIKCTALGGGRSYRYVDM